MDTFQRNFANFATSRSTLRSNANQSSVLPTQAVGIFFFCVMANRSYLTLTAECVLVLCSYKIKHSVILLGHGKILFYTLNKLH